MDTKERIIVLLEHLRENSDEGKAVSAADIRAMFRERGESVAAPTLRDDIASLIRAGYDDDDEGIRIKGKTSGLGELLQRRGDA